MFNIENSFRLVAFCAAAILCCSAKAEISSSSTFVPKQAPKFDAVHANFKSYEEVSAEPIAKNGEVFAINHGPFIQNLEENGVTITFTTNKPSFVWVEIAPDDGVHFYNRERRKFFEAPLGRKVISQIHNVKIDGLQSATKYRYRIFAREVTGASDTALSLGEVAASKVYNREAFKFATLNPEQKSVRFAVVNDVHGNYKRLAAQLKSVGRNLDFILLNGDMCNYAKNVDDSFKKFLDVICDATEGGVNVVFLRGNHETRGTFAQDILTLFPNPTGSTWRTFRVGSVAFVCIDTGEDKPDSDIEYSSNNDFDSFRTAEAEWLKGAISSKEVQDAFVKIAFAHMPLGISNPERQWHGVVDAKSKFAPLLNNRGIDILFSGHIHRSAFFEGKDSGLDFPNLVNSNTDMLIVEACAEKISVKTFDGTGKQTAEKTFVPKLFKK